MEIECGIGIHILFGCKVHSFPYDKEGTLTLVNEFCSGCAQDTCCHKHLILFLIKIDAILYVFSSGFIYVIYAHYMATAGLLRTSSVYSELCFAYPLS